MKIQDIGKRLEEIEDSLEAAVLTPFLTFERDGRPIHLALTERLRKAARKERIWRSREMLITLKNAAYGFDERQSRSTAGRDGIFRLDRDFQPPNEMMRKIFDRYLDRPDSGAADVARALGTTAAALLPVRLVSHAMRLLGVLHRTPSADHLVLVDCDRSE